MTYAMILAAGRGERMRPLTDEAPKPLLTAGEHKLIEHQILALAAGGIVDIVINHAHLGRKIVSSLGNGSRYGVRITYSDEPEGALETGGGIHRALPLLKSDPFVVINGDIWTDYPYSRLPENPIGLAHLVLVDNPAHHQEGDFVLNGQEVLAASKMPQHSTLTYSGIGSFRHALFTGLVPGRFPLAPVLIDAMSKGQVSGERYGGEWIDIGTPERLNALDQKLKKSR